MKSTVISLFFFIMAIQVASAIDFSLNSPTSTDLNEEFSVSLSAETTDIYDVKIFAIDKDSEITSLIYNDGWKNAYYYIKETFPDEKDYKIKIIHSNGNQQICARLRQTGKTSYSELCNDIEVNGDISSNDESTSDLTNKKTSTNKTSKKSSDNSKKIIVQQESPQVINNSITNNPETQSQKISINDETPNQGKIILNNIPSKEDLPKKDYSSSKNRMMIWIAYSFAAFCAAILALIFFKKI